ncbi:putative phospholipase B-like 2 [Trichonephila clavipes]|nr:putative phospholipase B-like 2 [Trichonephila clavipes]
MRLTSSLRILSLGTEMPRFYLVCVWGRHLLHLSHSKLKMTALLVLLTLCIPIVSCSIIKNASVTYNQQTKKFTIHDYIVDTSVAYGSFQDEIFQTGWSYLEVKSNAVFSDPVQAYAAGLVEGFLTQDLLKKHWINMAADYCVDEKPYCQRLQKFLQQNLNFMNKNIEIKRNYDVYWHQFPIPFTKTKGPRVTHEKVLQSVIPPSPHLRTSRKQLLYCDRLHTLIQP